MAEVKQVNPMGRTGRRFKCIAPFKFVRDDMVVADYVPGLEYYETETTVVNDKAVTGNKATLAENEDKIEWL